MSGFALCSGDWPKTAELKAIDVWTILCYAGAFFCLVEYSMVLWFSRQKVNKVEVNLPYQFPLPWLMNLFYYLQDGNKNSAAASSRKVLMKIEKYAKIIITCYTCIYPVLFFAVCIAHD